MNLYYVKCTIEGEHWDMMVVAGAEPQAEAIWAKAFFGESPDGARKGGKQFTAYLIDLAIDRTVPGCIDWGTFKFVPVEVP